MQKRTQASATAPAVNMADELLDRVQAAEFLRVSTRTLERLAGEGGGPAFMRIGQRRVVYRKEALLAWARAQEATSTSAEAARRGQAAA